MGSQTGFGYGATFMDDSISSSPLDATQNGGTSPLANARVGALRDDFGRQAWRLLLGFALILALLMGEILFSLRNFSQLVQADHLNVHSYTVLLKNNQVLQDVGAVQLGFRSFLLTGEEEQLQPFVRGQTNFAQHYAQLKQLTSDNPAQQQRLATLKTQWTQWIHNTVPVLKMRRSIADDEMSQRITNRNAPQRAQAMAQMRGVIQAIENSERQLLTQRSQAQELFQARTGQTLIFGGALSVLVVCGLGYLMLGNARRLSRANALLQHNTAQIENSNRALESMNDTLQRSSRDIERANTDLTRSNAELEQFAYVASHDLQEPLRAVSGCVQILQRRYANQLDERADTLIGHAVEGAQRMQTLINDLLAYSRAGTHGKPFEAINFDVVIAQVKSNLSVAIKESDALITQDEMPVVAVDAGQMEQVLQNLVSNALKFRGEAAPQIHLGAQRDEGQKAWIFSVADKGPGIEPQYFERIWVMFQRLHTRSEYPGTGIGLAICKKIVERHGGTVGVESEVGHGTRFWFSIPDLKPQE